MAFHGHFYWWRQAFHSRRCAAPGRVGCSVPRTDIFAGPRPPMNVLCAIAAESVEARDGVANKTSSRCWPQSTRPASSTTTSCPSPHKPSARYCRVSSHPPPSHHPHQTVVSLVPPILHFRTTCSSSHQVLPVPLWRSRRLWALARPSGPPWYPRGTMS